MGGAVTPPKHVLPTPPVPEDLPKITFANDNARLVFYKRYVRKNVAGEPAETPEETFWRVAYHVAKAEAEFGAGEEQVIERAKDFYRLLAERLFFPNSPTWTGAGTPLGQLAACFTPQMRVVTAQGLKPIVDVQVGDLVLTHQGRYRPVTETMQRSYSGPLYHIKIKGIGVVLEVTPEHPILTPSGWVEAQDLKVGDWVAVGVPQGVRAAPVFDLAQLAYAPELEVETTEDKVRARRPASYQRSGRQSRWNKRFVRLTPDLARLCGYYVAEGTIGPDERYVRFTLNKKETAYQEDIQALVRDIFGVEAQITPSNFGDWVQIDVYSRVVAAWFRTHFGRGSSGKYVPTWLLYAEDELQKAFLVGLFRGDGMYAEYTRPVSPKGKTKTWRSLRLTLANPNLVHQIWQMLLRIGYDANVRPVDTRYVTPRASETAQVDLPPLSSRDLVAEAFGKALPEPDKRYVRRHVHRQDGDIFFEVAAIQVVPFEGVVYNLEVDEDHTYVTEGVVVHNCFVLPISDDMGRKESGIFMSLRNAALIQQTGGGNGFSFSRLRPKNTIVKSSAGKATGPVGFLRVYDKAFGEIAQGGCLLPETLVFTDRGLLRLDEIVDAHQRGWQEHDLHVPTDQGLRRSPRGYNNGVASVLRVHTQEGLSLAGTPNHKVKVMTPQGPQWRALEDLQPGDWILVKLGEHRGHLQALRQPTRRHGNQVWPTLPAVLDEELAFFLGYFIGDGFLASREKDHRLGVTVAEDAYLVEEMPRLMERLFGVRVHRMQKRGDRSITFYLDNRAVKEFFLLNGFVKESSRTARVPRLVRLSPPNVVAAFLRGLFEADGTLSHGYPALVTTSRDLAREVATLLIGLGAPVRVHTVAAGVDAWGHHARYVVRILSHEGLEVWRRRIGCDLRSRFVQAYAWRVDTRRESSYVLPHAEYWLAPVLEAITLPQTDRRGRGQGKKFRSVQPRLRRRLLRYVRGGRRFTLAAYRELQQAYPEAFAHAPNPAGLWFVQVTGVEPIGEHLTLDLEVADNHTYLAYGLVTHNTRRGANMAVLRVDHPDIEDFITCKTDENAITNFNISVGVTDAFMRAVENDEEWALVFPDVLAPEYETFDGTLEDAVEQGVPIKVYKKVRARDLFAKIVQQAHHNGEPGMLFLDTANRDNPVPHQYRLEATNPCGEQWLGPYENCCLGSINLAQHATPEGGVDWDKLQRTVERAVRFLDDVVQANAYVPAVPQLKEAAHRNRRIGLGIKGLADLMYLNRVRYGSRAAQDFAAQIMEFIRYHAMRASIDLARERGPFPGIRGSIYDPEHLTWTPPTWPDWLDGRPSMDWGRPALDWDAIVEGLRRHGIRNAAQLTIAPTGTISTVSGVEGYGCEPVFALAYYRYVNDEDGQRIRLRYVSPLFMRALDATDLDAEAKEAVIQHVLEYGTIQNYPGELPDWLRNTFVVAQDVTAEEHVRMQAALQVFVDNSISKTINFPADATVDDVANAFMLAWKLGVKGLTVYVTGSRETVVLETKATAKGKDAAKAPAAQEPAPAQAVPAAAEAGGEAVATTTAPASSGAPSPTQEEVAVTQPQLWPEFKKPRPEVLKGFTFQVNTPLGKAFVTINENGGDQPFEVFINTAKAGSETAAISEAIGRLISYILRLTSPVKPIERLEEIIRQLRGIGGDRPLGFGPYRIRSLPDGVGYALEKYLLDYRERVAGNGDRAASAEAAPSPPLPLAEDEAGANGAEAAAPMTKAFVQAGHLCPECGQATLIYEEGCAKCYSCGYSEC